MKQLAHFKEVSIDLPVYGRHGQLMKAQIFQWATGGTLKREARRKVIVKALDKVTLTFHEGARVGLIGHNGAGKTTLLRALSGVYEPSQGRVTTWGKVTALFDVLFGVHEELTGRENLLLRGSLEGLSRKEVRGIEKKVVEWAQLGDYFHMPLRSYSNGMKLRLGFALATAVARPDIFLFDEIVGIGDREFQREAKNHLRTIIDQANLVVLASHDLSIIREMCDQVVWLRRGRVAFFGPVDEGLERYQKEVDC